MPQPLAREHSGSLGYFKITLNSMGTKENPHRTVAVIRELYEEILEQKRLSVVNGGQCVLWTGGLKRGYGRITKKINGYKHDLFVHQVVWMATQSPTQTSTNGKKISHLCHEKRCINRQHIVVEPMSVNNKRRECNRKKECQCKKNGHFDIDSNGDRVVGFKKCCL